MSVFRWILNDSGYRVCAIIHDRDTAYEDHAVSMPDGSEIEIKSGERVPEHYHAIIKQYHR